MLNPLSSLINAWQTWRAKRSMPLRLEFNVTDFCNLNCVGCTHYSPLARKEFEPIEQLTHNINTLGRACGSDIKEAYLIGGETLLYPSLAEAMRALRQAFPDAKLKIFTNGLLIPKMDDDFWKECKDLDFIIAVTRYPINFDYDSALDYCRSKGVTTEVYGDRSLANSFFRFGLDPDKGQNRRISHFKCYNSGCITVRGENVYPCSISGCIDNLNRVVGNRFKHEPGDFIPVDKVRSSKDIRRLRDKPVPFCSYCVLPPATVAYAPSKRLPSEWVD